MTEVTQAPADDAHTRTLPAHAVAEVKCGQCGVLLLVTSTDMGMSSDSGTGGHVCGDVLVPRITLSVRTFEAKQIADLGFVEAGSTIDLPPGMDGASWMEG